AVHLDAVGRPEVDDHPTLDRLADLGVAPRNVRVVDHQLALTAAADRHPLAGEQIALAVDRDVAAAMLAAGVVLRRGCGAVGCVDHRLAVVRLRWLSVTLRLPEQLRLDAEPAQIEALVGLEAHPRAPADRQVPAAV